MFLYICSIKVSVMTRDLFISIIDSLREQTVYDLNVSSSLGDVYKCDVPVYDNSILINAIKRVILNHFNGNEEVTSEIDHYCYFMNFGRIEISDEVLIEEPGALYDRLVLEYLS